MVAMAKLDAFPSPPPYVGPSSRKRVAYFYEPEIGAFSYNAGHPMKPYRMRIAHSLISAYGMLKHMDVIRPRRATDLDLTKFHTDEYINFLKEVTPDTQKVLTEERRFITGDDSPAWEGLYDFATVTAGGSISAAHSLVTGHSDIAINWAGGLHHAKRTESSGFCYVNDIVLGILELLRVHSRVLYIDIDIHHGDGVEEAFYTTDRVMTCSFHKFGDFFPGTGQLQDTGKGKGMGYSVNVPLREGIHDEAYEKLFKSVIGWIMEWYRPGAVVLQGGADSLAGDKLGVFNLSMKAHSSCTEYLRSFNVPLMMVGGGGYTVKNVARTWTYETAIACGISQTISPDLPYNEYLEWFGPRYKLEVLPNNMEDKNSPDYLENIRQHIHDVLKEMPFAPSAQMQRTAPGPLGYPAKDWVSDDSEDEEMDKRITQRMRDKHTSATSDPLTDSEDSEYDSDDAPMPTRRSLRSRKVPRKQRYYERFSPSPSPTFDGHRTNNGPNPEPYHRPLKKPRVFFAPPVVPDPGVADLEAPSSERYEEEDRSDSDEDEVIQDEEPARATSPQHWPIPAGDVEIVAPLSASSRDQTPYLLVNGIASGYDILPGEKIEAEEELDGHDDEAHQGMEQLKQSHVHHDEGSASPEAMSVASEPSTVSRPPSRGASPGLASDDGHAEEEEGEVREGSREDDKRLQISEAGIPRPI